MVKIDDLQRAGKIDFPMVFQTERAVEQQNDLARGGAAAPTRFLAHEQSEVLDRREGGEIRGGVVIADGMAFGVPLVLREDASQISLAAFGRAIGLFAFASGQFFFAHGQVGGVAAHIHDRRGARFGLAIAFGPSLRGRADALNGPLDLPRRDFDAAGFQQVRLRFLETRLVRPLQADQAEKRRGDSVLQRQGRVGRNVAAPFRRGVVIIPSQLAAAEDAVHLNGLAAFEMQAGRSLKRRVDPVGGLLQQHFKKLACAAEERLAQERFQSLQSRAIGLARAELIDDPLNLAVLGENQLRARLFFFEPAAMAARVSWILIWAYSLVKD